MDNTDDNTTIHTLGEMMDDNSSNPRRLCSFKSCTLKILNKDGDLVKVHGKQVDVTVVSEGEQQCSVNIRDGKALAVLRSIFNVYI